MINPNIFKPRNDWNVRSMKCRKLIDIDNSEIIKKMIAREVKDMFGISPFSEPKYQKQEYVQARQVFLTLMKKYTKKTLKDIGAILGKDHSTVTTSAIAVRNLYDTDKRFREMYDHIDQRIKLLN